MCGQERQIEPAYLPQLMTSLDCGFDRFIKLERDNDPCDQFSFSRSLRVPQSMNTGITCENTPKALIDPVTCTPHSKLNYDFERVCEIAEMPKRLG